MSWTNLQSLSQDNLRPIAERIVQSLDEGKTVLPEVSNWLRAFDLTPFETVKVIIVGQDPYPTDGHAVGLAFSVGRDVKPPKSLANIFRELREDTGIDRSNGDLTDWARQGVLLLNTSLTVVEGEPGSHSGIGWEGVTREALERLSTDREHLVFILWGKHAQRFEPIIDQSKHLIIKSAHPSPLSAHRGFFGSRPFSQTNAYLTQHGIEGIDW